ncbi:MAG: hypothetical protein Q7W02_14830 [Candidatus Rokubacteria bacterium]|nr:hypothetical protein [Candidatus Rokubacteria bacterium]
MLRRYLLGAAGLAAVASGALLYMVGPQTDWPVSSAQALASDDRRPVDSSATYLQQMKLTQETLRSFGSVGNINALRHRPPHSWPPSP